MWEFAFFAERLNELFLEYNCIAVKFFLLNVYFFDL